MTSPYHYELPEELVAKVPAEPRDSARLFVYDTASDMVSFDVFINIAKYLPERSLLVLNDTKVVPARLELHKETGGRVETLFLVNEHSEGGDTIPVIVDRKIDVGQKLCVEEYCFDVVSQHEEMFMLKPRFAMSELGRVFELHGITPIPPYLGKPMLGEQELRARYQTVFASNPASVAAPTASLHFTDRVFKSLEEKGIEKVFVTLHVGRGTFAPLKPDNLETKKLHSEYFEISPDAQSSIAAAKRDGRLVVAVGTTVVRALEAGKSEGSTDQFIHPPHNFRNVDSIITNFHVPESSLMYLVDAFLEYKQAKHRILELYKIAIGERFRFFSFGDTMLIL